MNLFKKPFFVGWRMFLYGNTTLCTTIRVFVNTSSSFEAHVKQELVVRYSSAEMRISATQHGFRLSVF